MREVADGQMSGLANEGIRGWVDKFMNHIKTIKQST
jgi:hypothetical protein